MWSDGRCIIEEKDLNKMGVTCGLPEGEKEVLF